MVTDIRVPETGSAGTSLIWVVEACLTRENTLLPTWVTVPIWLMLINRYEHTWKYQRKKLVSRVAPFKVIRGHRNCHGSIGYIWLVIDGKWAYLIPCPRCTAISVISPSSSVFSNPIEGVTHGISRRSWDSKNSNDVATDGWIFYSCNRFDIVLALDRQADRNGKSRSGCQHTDAR